ncbi:MAG: UTP--glucose-1-phosphate uridylyltransferase, partial [Planctomycetales bacterium]
MNKMKDELARKLEAFGQQHVLAFWDELSQSEREKLAGQISALDLRELQALFQDRGTETDLAEVVMQAEPPYAVRLGGGGRYSADEAIRRGQAALAAGKVGVILVAGGQGARLGFDHAKGLFPIGPVSGASLFQILLEKVLATGDRYASRIPVYVMTSPATHDETVDFLASNSHFGIEAEDVKFFCQATMPAFDAESGSLILSHRGQLFTSPDGHGGMLAALEKSRTLDDMRQRGLRHLFYFQVDNPLATVCDPELIGYHMMANSQYTLQVIAKQAADEKVGNVVMLDGVMRVIEYSDLPADAAALKTADGSLKLWAGSIAVNVFDFDFLCQMANLDTSLPF